MRSTEGASAASTDMIPASEPERMAAVRRYDILDTPPDHSFDRLTAIAAKHFDVPISIVTIVDRDRIWFKSKHGLDGVEQIGRDPGLCASAILQNEAWVVENAPEDPRALANPLVAGAFGLRFYAGAPLTTGDGHNLGTLCVIDKEPRSLTGEDARVLKDLAAIVVDELELRLAAIRTTAHERALRVQAERQAQVLQRSLLPPQLPALERVDLAARELPGGTHDHGCGFFDCFELPSESGYRLATVIGDVTPGAEDPSGAASVALARYTLRMAALSARSPSEMVEALNHVMFVGDDPGAPQPRVATLVVFAREKSGGLDLVAAGAGAGPGLVLHADASVTTLAPRGRLSGWDPDISFDEATTELPPGARLVLCTRSVAGVDRQREPLDLTMRLAGSETRTGAELLELLIGSARQTSAAPVSQGAAVTLAARP